MKIFRLKCFWVVESVRDMSQKQTALFSDLALATMSCLMYYSLFNSMMRPSTGHNADDSHVLLWYWEYWPLPLIWSHLMMQMSLVQSPSSVVDMSESLSKVLTPKGPPQSQAFGCVNVCAYFSRRAGLTWPPTCCIKHPFTRGYSLWTEFHCKQCILHYEVFIPRKKMGIANINMWSKLVNVRLK